MGGAEYLYSLLTGFHGEKMPAGFKVPEGKYFNPYYEGWNDLHAAAALQQWRDLFRRNQGHHRAAGRMTW